MKEPALEPDLFYPDWVAVLTLCFRSVFLDSPEPHPLTPSQSDSGRWRDHHKDPLETPKTPTRFNLLSLLNPET
jgi:hypothetical protein